jgi:hypothetical protein
MRVTNSFLRTIVGIILEHRLALVRVDAEGGDHVEQRVGVDVLLMRVAAEHELELGRGDQLADDVLDVVADDALGGGEVADAHADDPALVVGDVPLSRHCSMSLPIGMSSGSQWLAFILR